MRFHYLQQKKKEKEKHSSSPNAIYYTFVSFKKIEYIRQRYFLKQDENTILIPTFKRMQKIMHFQDRLCSAMVFL